MKATGAAETPSSACALRAHVTRIIWFLALAGLAVAIIVRFKAGPSRHQKLPDGTIMRIADVFYGTNYAYRWWTQGRVIGFVATHLPYRLAQRLGLDANIQSLGTGPADKPFLAVITIYQSAGATRYDPAHPERLLPTLEAEFLDDRGKTLRTEVEKGYEIHEARYARKPSIWTLSPVPRGSKNFVLRLREQSKQGRPGRDLGGFTIPNPVYDPTAP